MPDLEQRLELQLREALRGEGDRVRLTVTADRLRLAAAERRRRRHQLWVVGAVAAASVLVVGVVSLAPFAMQPEVGASPSDFASPSASPTPAASGPLAAFLGPTDIPLRCANHMSPEPELTFTFPSGVLAGPAIAEAGSTPASLALGELLRQDPPDPALPPSGWVLATETPRAALFLAPTPEADDPEPYVQAVVELNGGSWSVRYGLCDPLLDFDGVPPDPWRLDGGFPAPGPDEQSIKVIQESPLCADGTIPPGMRPVPAPLVIEGDDWVGIGLAEFDVAPYCEPGPSADARIGLDRPLGSRVLLDLSRFPFPQRAWDSTVQAMDPSFPAFSGPGGVILEVAGTTDADPEPRDIDFRPWSGADLVRLELRCAGEGRVEVALAADARRIDCAGFSSLSFVPTASEFQPFSVQSTGSVRYALRLVGLWPEDRYAAGPSDGVRPPETVITWPGGFARAWPGCATSVPLMGGEVGQIRCGDEWQPIPSSLAIRTSGVPELGVVTASGWAVTSITAAAVPVQGGAGDAAVDVDPAGAVPLEVRSDERGTVLVAPDTGDWLVRILMTAARDGTTLEAEYFARLVTEP